MHKRIISLVLALTLALTALYIGSAAVSAADNTASIKVGGKTYTASVGDYLQYTVSFRYPGKRVATAQLELPVDFTALESYSQDELDSFTSEIAPVSGSNSLILRSQNDIIPDFTGYVMNFVNPTGYSFFSEKVVLSLIFSVERSGSYELKSKLRHVDASDGTTIIDKNYQSADSKFICTEALEPVKLDTPKITVATAAGGMKVSWDPVLRAGMYRVFYKGRNGWTKLTDTKDTSVLDTDVVGGTRYTYTVRCLSADGKRYVSDYDTAGKSAVYYPAPVLRLSNTEEGVSIKWAATSGADKYRIYHKGRNGWARLVDTADTSYVDTDVTAGTTYTYTIRSMDPNGNLLSSYYPDGFSITYLSAPDFSLSNAPDGVNISWNKVEGAEKYRVFYKGSKGWTKLVDTAETSFIDTDVVSGYNYTYTVRCLSADGAAYTSDYRAGKSLRYYAAPVLTLSNAEDGVNIKWSAVSGAAKYRVYYKGRNGWTRLVDTTSTSFVDTDVASGTNYTYTIRCLDSSSDLISSYYPDGFRITFLSAPSFSVTNAPDGVRISWDKVTGAEKYRIFYYGSRGWTRLVDTDETSFVDTDVSSNHNYTYTVRCINADGTSYTSDFRSGRSVRYYEAPKLTLSNASNGVNITWNAVSGAAKYRVYYMGRNGWTRLIETASTSFLDKDVKSGTNYTYTIRCLDSGGNFISTYYPDGFKIRYTPAS